MGKNKTYLLHEDGSLEKLKDDELKKAEAEITEILKDNIHFSGQLDAYIIHGAIEKLILWREAYAAEQLNKMNKLYIEAQYRIQDLVDKLAEAKAKQ
jgi:hypothetical protein